MSKILQSFRSKMVLLLGLSMLLSSIITFLLFKGLQLYYYTRLSVEINYLCSRNHGNMGDLTFFLLLFILLSILFFFFLTKPYSTYLNEIAKGIHYLAQGDLKHRVQIFNQMMNLVRLQKVLIWQVKNWKKPFNEAIFRKAVRINWS